MAWTSVETATLAQAGGQLAGVVVFSEEAADNSLKTLSPQSLFGADTKDLLEILGVRVEYTASADAGNRQLTLSVLDAVSDVTSSMVAQDVIAATEAFTFEFFPGASAQVPVTGYHYEQMPCWILQPSESLLIWDSADVAAEADDMIVHVRARRWSRS